MKVPSILNKSKLTRWAPVLALITLIFALFSTLIFEEHRINLFFSSDTLYLPSIYKDLFIDKNNIDGWHFNPAPNFFPDMAFYFILMFITKNFILSTFIFSLVQSLVVAFLLVRIFKFVFPARSDYFGHIIYGLLSLILLETFFYTRDLTFVFNVVINSYHMGAFVMALLCFLLTLKFYKDKKWSFLFFLFCLESLCVLSDRLFIILFIVPVGITSIVLARSTGIKNVLGMLVVSAASVVTGQLLFMQIDKDNSSLTGRSGNEVTMEIMKVQFSDFYGQMTDYLSYFSFRSLSILLFLISFLLIIFLFFNSWKSRKQQSLTFVSLFTIIFSVLVICTPMLSGKYEGWDCLRYNIYPFLLTGLSFAMFAAYKIKNKTVINAGKFLLMASTILLLYLGISQFDTQGFKGYLNYYPESARLVDSVADKENLRYGVANYWDAKKISMFSKKNVKIYSVFDNVSFYEHVVNEHWFYDHTFDFILLTSFSDTTLYKQYVKDARFVSNAPKLRLIKTHPFTYSRFTGSIMVNKE